MRIGLISDTHVPDVVEALPVEVEEVFRGVDLILHAGDIAVVSVLDSLHRIAPVLAARGDDDYQIQDERVQEVQTVEAGGLFIYVIHSSQYWARSVVEHPENHDLDRTPDVVVYGHTHREIVEEIAGSLVVNPGSATFPWYQLRLGTVALLDIESGRAEARIVDLRTKRSG